jgi:hypothetical protein
LRARGLGNTITGALMKFLIALVIIVGLSLGAWQFYTYWGNYKAKDAPSERQRPAEIPDDQLEGMPSALQPALNAARERGAPGLKDFLSTYGNTINDPRRAAIELDYTVLIAPSNPSEARRAYAKVKARLQPTSPVYDRMKQLEKTYED